MCSSGHWDCLRNTLQRNVENQNILSLFDVKKENIACDVGVKMLRYYLYNVKKDKCFREKVAKQVDWSQRFANEIYSICIHWYLKKRSYITVSRPWTKLKVVLVETHKLELKGSIYFSNNQCKILYQDEYLFVCVVILHYRSNKCIQCPIWRQIQPIHCIHYIWRHWFWLANGYIRKPRVLSYVIKYSCRKVQQYSSWEKWIGLFIFIDLTKCAPQFETASRWWDLGQTQSCANEVKRWCAVRWIWLNIPLSHPIAFGPLDTF